MDGTDIDIDIHNLHGLLFNSKGNKNSHTKKHCQKKIKQIPGND